MPTATVSIGEHIDHVLQWAKNSFNPTTPLRNPTAEELEKWRQLGKNDEEGCPEAQACLDRINQLPLFAVYSAFRGSVGRGYKPERATQIVVGTRAPPEFMLFHLAPTMLYSLGSVGQYILPYPKGKLLLYKILPANYGWVGAWEGFYVHAVLFLEWAQTQFDIGGGVGVDVDVDVDVDADDII